MYSNYTTKHIQFREASRLHRESFQRGFTALQVRSCVIIILYCYHITSTSSRHVLTVMTDSVHTSAVRRVISIDCQ